MPGPFSSPGSIEDAWYLGKNLGIRFELLPLTMSSRLTVKHCAKYSLAEKKTSLKKISNRARAAHADGALQQVGCHCAFDGNKSELGGRLLYTYGDMWEGCSLFSDVQKHLSIV